MAHAHAHVPLKHTRTHLLLLCNVLTYVNIAGLLRVSAVLERCGVQSDGRRLPDLQFVASSKRWRHSISVDEGGPC